MTIRDRGSNALLDTRGKRTAAPDGAGRLARELDRVERALLSTRAENVELERIAERAEAIATAPTAEAARDAIEALVDELVDQGRITR